MQRDTALAILKRHETELRQLGVESLALFGSTARDQATDQSDVDIEVKLTNGTRGFAHLDRLKKLKAVLRKILQRHVDVITDTAGSQRLRQAIERDRVNAF